MNRRLAVLLLLALVAPQGAQGQLSPADVVVTGLRVVGEAGWVDGAPVDPDLEIEVDLRNDGGRDSTGYVVRYSWVDPDGTATYLNGAEENSFNAGQRLPAGAERTERADWHLQPGQAGQGAVRVTVTHDGSTVATDFPVFVTDRRLSFSLVGGAQQILPDETRFFRLAVTNEGNVDEAVDLLLPDAGEGDNRRLEATWSPAALTVPAGSRQDAVLFVEYPFTGVTTDFSAAFTIHAQTGFREDPVVLRTPPVTPASGGFPSGYSFTLGRAGAGTVFAAPGEAREVELTIRNTAAATADDLSDTYRVDADATGGWSASLARDRSALEEGASDTLRVRLRAPDEGLPGAPAELRVEVVSDHDDPADPRFPARLTVPLRLSGPAVVVTDLRTEPSPLYVGDVPQVRVTLRNEGDQSAPLGSLRVRMTSPGQSAQAEGPVGALEPGGTTTRRLTLEAVEDGGELALEALWQPPEGLQAAPAPSHRTVFVHEPDLVLLPARAVDGVPGSDVRYAAAPHAFTIRNAGNAAETVLLSVTAQGGTARLLGDESLLLEPGDVRTIPLVQGLPSPTGDLLPRAVTVTAAVEGRPGRTWNATTQTGIDDSQPPLVRPGTVPAEWLRTAPLTLRAVASDATAVAAVSMRVTAPNGSVAVVDLQRGAEADAWTAGHLFGADGNHTLALTAIDAAGNEATAAPRVVRVGSIPPPVLEPVAVRSGDEAPWGGSFPVAVNDTREVASLLVRVAGADGEPRSFPVANGRAMVRLAEVPGLEPGDVTLLLEATNAAGASAVLELDLVVLEPEPVTGDVPSRSDGRFAPAGHLAPLALLAAALVVRRRTR